LIDTLYELGISIVDMGVENPKLTPILEPMFNVILLNIGLLLMYYKMFGCFDDSLNLTFIFFLDNDF
jgi:hypothetical protein